MEENKNDLACYTLLTIYDIINSLKNEDNDLIIDFYRTIFESKELACEIAKTIKYSSYDKALNLNKKKSILFDKLKSLSKEDIISFLDEKEKKCKTDALLYKKTNDGLINNSDIKYKPLSGVYIDKEKGTLKVPRKVLSKSRASYITNTIGEKLYNGAGKLAKMINHKNK